MTKSTKNSLFAGFLLVLLCWACPTTAFQSRAPLSIQSRLVVHAPNSLFLSSPVEAAKEDVIEMEVAEASMEIKQEVEVVETTTTSAGERARKYAKMFCNLFPIWTLLTATVALKRPQTFLSIPSSTFPAQIGLLMLCMGITLTPNGMWRLIANVLASFYTSTTILSLSHTHVLLFIY